MADRRSDARFGWRVRGLGVVAGVAGVVAAAVAWSAGRGAGAMLGWLAAAGLAWALAAAAALWLYRCPSCRRRIGTLAPGGGGPGAGTGRGSIVFDCPACGVAWDTTLSRLRRDRAGGGPGR